MQGDAKSSRWSALRTRVYAVAAVCLIPAVIGGIVALTSLSSVNASVKELNGRSVRTLGIFGDLRDMQGDSRVSVWVYLASAPADRPDVRRDMLATDQQADADIRDYLAVHPGAGDPFGALMRTFQGALLAWRQVRDNQVIPAADAGHPAGAYTVAFNQLDAANEAMAAPLDNLYEREVATAATVAKSSEVAYTRVRLLIILVLVVGLILAQTTGVLLTRGVLAALDRVNRVVSSGDRTARIGELKDRSEIGTLSLALDEMFDAMAVAQAARGRDQAAREQQLIETSVRQRLAEREVRRRAQLVINEASGLVLTELREVLRHAGSVRGAAQQIESGAADAGGVTRDVVGRAEGSQSVVTAMAASLQRVDGVAKLIAGVTEQTNLLSLNATIEAARAGAAGKGFSVVAGEVKELAGRTKDSTTEITNTVAALEKDASAMAAIVAAMTEGVTGISEANSKVTSLATAQRESADRLDRAVREAITKVESMNELTDQLERRVYERMTVDGTVTLRAGTRTVSGGMLDLSVGGLLCAVPVGSGLVAGATVEVDLPLGERTERIRARVARCTPVEDREHIGLEFQQVGQAAATYIREYLNELLERRETVSASAT